LEEKLKAQQQINSHIKAELKRTEDVHNENKALKRRLGDKDDEVRHVFSVSLDKTYTYLLCLYRLIN